MICPILLLLILVHVVGFRVTKNDPVVTAIYEGDTVKLSCTVTNWYNICSFKLENKQCEFHYDDQSYHNSEPYPVKKKNCADLDSIIEFVGDYYNYNCAIKLGPVSLSESGLWTCEFKEYNSQATSITRIFVKVLQKNTAPTTRGPAPTTPTPTTPAPATDTLSNNPHFILLNEASSFKPDPTRKYSHYIEIRRDSCKHEITLEGYSIIVAETGGKNVRPDLVVRTVFDLSYSKLQENKYFGVIGRDVSRLHNMNDMLNWGDLSSGVTSIKNPGNFDPYNFLGIDPRKIITIMLLYSPTEKIFDHKVWPYNTNHNTMRLNNNLQKYIKAGVLKLHTSMF